MAKYFPDNKRWFEITRDERYFCAELYHEFKSCPDMLVRLINEKLPPDNQLISELWELGFEVCFYRDVIRYRHLKYGSPSIRNISFQLYQEDRSERTFPFKRTFDLCLFGDNVIVIIEAKVHEAYESEQLKSFIDDRAFLSRPELYGQGIEPPDVIIVGLHSSNYNPNNETLMTFTNSAFLTWSEVADVTSSNEKAVLFEKADRIKIEHREL